MCTPLRALHESFQEWKSQGLRVNMKLTKVINSKVTWQQLKGILVLNVLLQLVVVLRTHLHD